MKKQYCDEKQAGEKHIAELSRLFGHVASKEEIAAIYQETHARIEKSARVKQFIEIIAMKEAKESLSKRYCRGTSKG